ncbi:MAG TPA: hypothetical protein ENI05_01350 [Porticoccus sp.]|nr:hypothetical protein [Porticoccus sp.]
MPAHLSTKKVVSNVRVVLKTEILESCSSNSLPGFSFSGFQLLGHSDPTVTQRYAHLATRALHEAAGCASTCIGDVLPKRPEGSHSWKSCYGHILRGVVWLPLIFFAFKSQ